MGEFLVQLYRAIIPVPDIEKAQAFYDAAFRIDGERVSRGRHYYDLGGVIFAIYDPRADGDEPAGGWRYHPFQYVYVAVDDLALVVSRVAAAGGIMISKTVEAMPWGETLFYCTDPFGAPLCFVQKGTEFKGAP